MVRNVGGMVVEILLEAMEENCASPAAQLHPPVRSSTRQSDSHHFRFPHSVGTSAASLIVRHRAGGQAGIGASVEYRMRAPVGLKARGGRTFSVTYPYIPCGERIR